MPMRIFRDEGLDGGPHLSEKCFVVIDLCIPVLAFPRVGVRLVEQCLKNCKHMHGSMVGYSVHTTSSCRVSKPSRAFDSPSLLLAQLSADETRSSMEPVLARYRAFSSSVKASSVNKILGNGAHVRAHVPT